MSEHRPPRKTSYALRVTFGEDLHQIPWGTRQAKFPRAKKRQNSLDRQIQSLEFVCVTQDWRHALSVVPNCHKVVLHRRLQNDGINVGNILGSCLLLCGSRRKPGSTCLSASSSPQHSNIDLASSGSTAKTCGTRHIEVDMCIKQ